MPLGLYDHADDTPGVTSIEIGSNVATRFLRDATRFLERLDDALPGLGDFFGIGA